MLVLQPVQANIKENIFKLHITGPGENPLVTSGFPLQKARNVANGNTIANQNRHMQKLLAIQPEMK